MTDLPFSRPHPVLAFALGVRSAAKDIAGVDPTFMTAAEKEQALVELHRARAQVDAWQLRLLAASDDVADAHGARDAAAWLSAETRTDYRPARARLELARQLERWTGVAGALLAGDLTPEHARSIADALDALPPALPDDVVERAEAILVGHAGDFRPAQVARLGRRILEVVAPEIAEAEEARRLREQEQRAKLRVAVRFRSLGEGLGRVVLDLPDSWIARLTTYLEAFAAPRRQEAGAERVPHSRRLAEAFEALLEHLDPRCLPDHGGDARTVMVTIGLEQLRADLAAAGLVDGDLEAGPDLTADEARRLACTAQIIPVVLGGAGEILDLGRSRRLFSPAQRKAMRLRDRQCRADGCTAPASWCEAHHLTGWAIGGRTDLDDGVLLCSHHHHRAHDPGYDVQRLPSGDFRFHRRT